MKEISKKINVAINGINKMCHSSLSPILCPNDGNKAENTHMTISITIDIRFKVFRFITTWALVQLLEELHQLGGSTGTVADLVLPVFT